MLVGRRPQLNVKGEMVVGSRFKIRAEQFAVQITVRPGGELLIGNRVSLNQGVNLLAATKVVIGDDCMFGDLAAVRDTDSHQVAPDTPVQTAEVTIGRNVWVGRNAIIMPGVTIGDHAVIAAGAIVTRDVPSCTVVAGVPAAVVREFEVPDSDWNRE